MINQTHLDINKADDADWNDVLNEHESEPVDEHARIRQLDIPAERLRDVGKLSCLYRAIFVS